MPRAKNNLSTFDIDQIEADLMAVEAEILRIDPYSQKDTSLKTVKSNADRPTSEADAREDKVKSEKFKPHPVNVVNFNPDNSKLLHKVLRTDKKPEASSKPKFKVQTTAQAVSQPKAKDPAPRIAPTKPAKETGKTVAANPKQVSFKTVKKNPVSAPPAVDRVKQQRANPSYGMDGFKKTSALEIDRPVSSVNTVALTGMKRANQFNRYVMEQHGTSLQNQLEKQSLFERSLDGDVEIFDKGLQTNDGGKVYNVGRRKTMLGGVDQHNLGPGKARRVLGYRSMKFLMPVFALLFIGGYVMYLNMPSISIKVAESKSGVAISEPSYTPSGYRLAGPIEANTGQVAMSFKNGDAAFNVSQKVSDWDSKALLENKILKETKEYSAYTDRGLTIYVYAGKATWVNQGKVFEIKLDGSDLETEELIRIAGSM